MADALFFENPSFRAYVRMLAELHRLVREDRDESAEGEELRDRMDAPGDHLARAEVAAIKGIAADFHGLRKHQLDVPMFGKESPHLERAIVAARESGRFHEALELARRGEGALPPWDLAWLRGSIWHAAQEEPIARLFFDRAAELQPAK